MRSVFFSPLSVSCFIFSFCFLVSLLYYTFPFFRCIECWMLMYVYSISSFRIVFLGKKQWPSLLCCCLHYKMSNSFIYWFVIFQQLTRKWLKFLKSCWFFSCLSVSCFASFLKCKLMSVCHLLLVNHEQCFAS